MFDAKIQPLLQPLLKNLAKAFILKNISANVLTAIGFALTLPMFSALYWQEYGIALFFLFLNRLFDGLDGVAARQSKTGPTDFGGYIDIVSDFIFYSGFVFFFALGQPDQVFYALFLLFSFFASGTSFLAYAIISEKRRMKDKRQINKSFYYMSGLAEGAETILAFALICLLPSLFWLIAIIFGAMCWLTALGRVILARKMFK